MNANLFEPGKNSATTARAGFAVQMPCAVVRIQDLNGYGTREHGGTNQPGR
jgi:hypothetical protein